MPGYLNLARKALEALPPKPQYEQNEENELIRARCVEAEKAPHGNCPLCGSVLDRKRRCWRRECCDRVCPCGRMTGSAFIQLCMRCGLEAN